MCNSEAVSKLAHEGPDAVEKFLLEGAAKVEFDRREDGSLARTLEASHNRARIIHWHDHTGKVMRELIVELP